MLMKINSTRIQNILERSSTRSTERSTDYSKKQFCAAKCRDASQCVSFLFSPQRVFFIFTPTRLFLFSPQRVFFYFHRNVSFYFNPNASFFIFIAMCLFIL